MEIVKFIDHTLLKADATTSDISKLCEEAKQHQFKAVCISPYYVEFAARVLQEHPIKVATVVGFPLGYSCISSKVEEITKAVQHGADEIDAVVNISAVKSENWNYIKNEISSLVTATHIHRKTLKLILETALLNEEEITQLCKISSEMGVDFIKNSTGFQGRGATLDTIRFLRAALPDHIQIKAAGGIRTASFAQQLIEAGGSRIGTSNGVAIAKGQELEIM